MIYKEQTEDRKLESSSSFAIQRDVESPRSTSGPCAICERALAFSLLAIGD